MRVRQVEQNILALSEHSQALQDAVSELPKDIQRNAADHMRLSTGYGRDGGAIKFEMFLNSLSPSEFDRFHKWWRDLSRGDQDAILAGA